METEDRPFIIETTKQYDAISRQWASSVYVKLHVSARTSGLIGEMGPQLWQTLCVLATYMDETGYCYPSAEQVAVALNISEKSAQRRLSDLAEFRWKGRQIVTRYKGRQEGGQYANYRYSILPLSQLSIFDGDIEEDGGETPPSIATTPKGKQPSDSKAILSYFIRKHEETYGVKYLANFGRDTKLIRDSLLPTFGAELLAKIIDVVFEQYSRKWATPGYERPTVGALASWLANKAAVFVTDAPAQLELDDEIDDYEDLFGGDR